MQFVFAVYCNNDENYHYRKEFFVIEVFVMLVVHFQV